MSPSERHSRLRTPLQKIEWNEVGIRGCFLAVSAQYHHI